MNSTDRAKLTLNEAGGIYTAFMEEIKTRLKAIAAALRRIEELRGVYTAFLHAEFCYLQLRMICELIALAVLSAHNEVPQANTNAFLDKWNADAIFDRLIKLSPHCYPTPLKATTHPETGQLHFEALEGEHLSRGGLKQMYHACGENLHRGILKHIYEGKQKAYDPAQLNEWAWAIHRLLSEHLVLLPDLNSVLFVQMAGEDGKVHWHYAVAEDGGEYVVKGQPSGLK